MFYADKAPQAAYEPTHRDALTVAQFCDAHGFSRALFYKLAIANRPAVIRVGRRVLISREAGAAWRKKLEDAR